MVTLGLQFSHICGILDLGLSVYLERKMKQRGERGDLYFIFVFFLVYFFLFFLLKKHEKL